MTNDYVSWFSGSYETIEQAQEWYKYDLFNPAAIFELPSGGFVLGYIREQNCPPHQTALNIKKLTGYQMVSYCDPLLGVWSKYES